MKKSIEQKIFEWAHLIGECTVGDTHIIDMADRFDDDGEARYRIYHKDGYCVDVAKLIESTDDDTGSPVKYYFDISQEWPEFKKADYELFYKLLNPHNYTLTPKK